MWPAKLTRRRRNHVARSPVVNHCPITLSEKSTYNCQLIGIANYVAEHSSRWTKMCSTSSNRCAHTPASFIIGAPSSPVRAATASCSPQRRAAQLIVVFRGWHCSHISSHRSSRTTLCLQKSSPLGRRRTCRLRIHLSFPGSVKCREHPKLSRPLLLHPSRSVRRVELQRVLPPPEFLPGSPSNRHRRGDIQRFPDRRVQRVPAPGSARGMMLRSADCQRQEQAKRERLWTMLQKQTSLSFLSPTSPDPGAINHLRSRPAVTTTSS